MALTQNGAASGKPKQDVAVYVDYENLYISLRSTVGQNPNFDVIMDKCREFGRLTQVRAYADWSEFARVVTSQMFSSGVEPIYVPTRKFYDAKTRSQATKNSVDIVITIDIMKDVLLSKNIDIFVLVSGDRDFVPLMNQIRAAGKEVYAIGVAGCTSSELAVAVDEMFYYHQLLESEEDLAAEQKDIYGKLVRAVEIARARGYRATLGVVKPILRELVVGFDEKKVRNNKGVPFQQFKQFVREAERQGFIRVAESGENFELFLATENIVERRPAKDREREHGRPGRRDAQAQSPPARGPVAAAEPGEGGESEETAEGAEAAAAAAPAGESPSERAGGRRRGRRGGRGRRRRADGADEAQVAGGDPDNGPEGEGEGDGAEGSELEAEAHAEAEAPAPVQAPPAPSPRASRRESEPAREPRPSRAPVAAAPVDEDSDEDEEAALAGLSDATLPDEAMNDLESIMKTFAGRAPSQRRLIARLKKGSAAGELRGDYREGQFLLMVRKALQDGRLEKVSKGFYAGLRWNDEAAQAEMS
jgi:uncharacterized LabA/DUF88 family protein